MGVRNFGNIYALFHFDYPYIYESGDGLHDEVTGRNDIFKRTGNVKFAGHETAELITDEAPLWGYRCPYFPDENAKIECTDMRLLPIIKRASFECEFFVKFKVLTNGDIFNLSEIFKITLSANSIKMTGTEENFSVNINTWYHVRLRFYQGEITLFIDGTKFLNANSGALSLVEKISIGGFNGYIDELVFRVPPFNNNSRPDYPYQAYLDVNLIGGFGNASLGDVVISSNCKINTQGIILSSVGSSLQMVKWNNGKFGAAKVGDEVLLIVAEKKGSDENDIGRYAFRRIKAINTTTSFTLEYPVNEFDLENAVKNYKVYAVVIPEFKNLTIEAGATISANLGVVALRVAEDFILRGKIITSDDGPTRSDLLQMTHSNLIDRFLLNRGGGIFITCGGTFSASSTARLGGSWDGANKGGNNENPDGGAGYGGAGGVNSKSKYSRGFGGVGGGGGAASSCTTPSHAGADGTTGGWYYKNNSPYGAKYPGGTQGVNLGAKSDNSKGGGGALGMNDMNGLHSPGSCLILVAKNLNADLSAISTGGYGCRSGGSNIHGGGGTGMCYIACEGVH